jgi:hypothetical protein
MADISILWSSDDDEENVNVESRSSLVLSGSVDPLTRGLLPVASVQQFGSLLYHLPIFKNSTYAWRNNNNKSCRGVSKIN